MKDCDNDNTVTYSNVTQANNLSPKILPNYPRKNALFTIRENATPILMALFSAGLAGCSTGPTTTTGTALKGRLENAEVFIDTNGDGSWTSGIDSDKVRTDSSGNFSIPESSDLTGDIVVTTDKTTIDTSSGSMISGVTLSAPNGSSVVSVATTLTNELMDSSTATLTQTEAEAQVKTLLGIDPTIDVSSYDPFTEDNIGTAAALEFEQSAHQVMTIINTLAEAESSTNVGTEVTKSEAVDNAIKAFVDVIETEISNNTDTALDFTASSVIDSIVAEYDDTSSALKDASFSDSLTAIKTAITQVNTAIDTVTSLSTEHNPTFAIAQSNLVDMTQSVAENNNGSLATIDSTTNISTLLSVNGTFLGTSSEDSSDDSNTDGDIELSGSIAVIDPDTADAVTFSFSTTVTSSDGALGSLVITESGAWTYTLDDSVSSIQSLDAGDIYKESFAVTANASDSSSSVSKTIRISVTGTNDAPTVIAVIADQSIAEDSTLSFVVPDGSFADVDSGDSLTYTATLADGSELPTWLSFDGNTKTFSGTPTNDAVGNIEVAVTATDSASASISDTYTLTVSNTNDVPTLETTLVDQSATEGTEFSYAIASSSFADVDSGDTLTYTTTQTGGAALPSWLSFDGDTQTFSGTPTAEATLDITVTASDSTAMITDAFSLTVANTNDAPVFTSSASVSTTERTYLADTVTATDEEDDAISYSISGGADSGFFGIDSSSGALTFSGADNVRASSLIALPTNASQPSVLFDNFAIDGTTATVDAYLLPKAAGFDALTGFQMNMTTSSGSVSFGASASGWTIIANAGSLSGFSNNIAYADLQATKIGTFTIADYSTSATTTVSGIVFDGGVYGSTSTSSQTMANLTLTPVTAPPINGANGSANADDIYTVEVTATDANSATTAQTLNVTVTATADADHASVTSTWTGTSSADTYTIDEYSGLTITADGGDGGNDTVKLAVLDHVLWDTTSGGTTELTATLVDMEIIDIGNLVSNNDSTAVTIGDFSTNMAIDSTSAASLIDGNDSQVSIMGTANDIVTLSGTTWDKGVSSNLSSGDYASETLVAWSDGTSTLYIDQDINIVTPDIT